MKAIIHLHLLLSLLAACTGFQEATLITETPLVQIDSAELNKIYPPVLSKNQGIFFGKNAGVEKFVASHDNIIIGKSGNAMIVELNNVGADWEQVSIKFTPLDFTVAPYLILKARLDLKSPDSLKLRIDLIDENGYMTNYTPQEKYIRRKTESKAYKYTFAGNWVQNWPFRIDVNPKRITEIRINFNGGGPNYSGRVYIEELFATDGKIKNQNPENYIIESFDEEVAGWWSANSMTLTAEEVESKNVAKLILEDAGPAWESFGKRFGEAINFSKTPIMRIRLMADAPGKLRVQVADAKEYSTNAFPPVIDFPKTSTFTDIYADFTGKFIQSHPTQQIVDSTQIKMIAFFVNAPPEPYSYTGTIIIDEIAVLSLAEYEKIRK
jgi:hypothetical protein